MKYKAMKKGKSNGLKFSLTLDQRKKSNFEFNRIFTDLCISFNALVVVYFIIYTCIYLSISSYLAEWAGHIMYI